MRKVKHLLVAGVLVLAAALSGCANDPGVFATVNGQQISASEYEAVADAYREYLLSRPDLSEEVRSDPSQLANVVKQDTVRVLVFEEILPELYAALGQTYDESVIDNYIKERKKTIKEDYERKWYENPYGIRIEKLIYSWSVLSNVFGYDALYGAVNRQDVELNPRYGYWQASLEGVELASSSLSTRNLSGSFSKVEQDDGK